jgi:GNAT superfamily N-acetyltransferase
MSQSDTDARAGGAAGAADAISEMDPRELERHAPDAHLTSRDAAGTLRARCSCWWRHVPQLEGQIVGTIGHYAAVAPAAANSAGRAEADARASAETVAAASVGVRSEAAGVVSVDAGASPGVSLIEEACQRLRDAGCTMAIAPMDGNTWRRYRFVIERGEEPPFFLEPEQPEAWVEHFKAAGFIELATYTSALNDDLAQEDPRLQTAASRLASRGVTIRAFDPSPARTEVDLRRIFALSLASFSRNYLYTPIGEAEFVEQYRMVLPVVRPELVLLAEHGDALVGFLFAIPDMLEARRTGAISTIIIKTVAVAPEPAYAGLGSLLVGMVQREAHARGYRRAIHALMHEHNVSQNISRRYARTIRRYALFARALAQA